MRPGGHTTRGIAIWFLCGAAAFALGRLIAPAQDRHRVPEAPKATAPGNAAANRVQSPAWATGRRESPGSAAPASTPGETARTGTAPPAEAPPRARAAPLLSLGPEFQRLAEALNRGDTAQLARLLRELAQSGDGAREEALLRWGMAHWCEIEPQSALRFLLQAHRDSTIAGDFRSRVPGFLQAALTQLASQGMGTCLDWLIEQAQNAGDAHRVGQYQSLLYRLVRTARSAQEPEALVRLLEQQDARLRATFGDTFADSVVRNAAQTFAYSYAGKDVSVEDVVTALERFPDEPSRETFLRNLLTVKGRSQPAGAADILTDPRVYATAGAATAARYVLTSWTREDRDAATAWVEALPAGEMKRAAVAGLLTSWATTESDQAVKWVEQNLTGADRDAAYSDLARSRCWQQPQKATQWAESIRDAGTRREAYQRIYATWLSREPVKAARWVQSLPPEERALVRRDSKQ